MEKVTIIAVAVVVIAFALSIIELLLNLFREGGKIIAEQIKTIKMIKRSIELKEFYSGPMPETIKFEDGETEKKDGMKNESSTMETIKKAAEVTGESVEGIAGALQHLKETGAYKDDGLYSKKLDTEGTNKM